MKQRHNSVHNRLHHLWQRTLPAQSLCLVGSFSLVSSGLAFAQTDSAIDNIVPTVENSQPAAPVAGNIVKKETVEQTIIASEAAKPQPEFSQRRNRLKQRLKKVESSQPTETVKPQSRVGVRTFKTGVTVSQPATSTKISAPQTNLVREQKPKVEFAAPVAPRSIPKQLPTVAQPANDSPGIASWAAGKTKDYNNAYIDPTDYNQNTTSKYDAPSSVVVIERASGCQAVLARGISSLNCAKAAGTSVASTQKTTPAWLNKSQNTRIAAVPAVQRVATNTSNTGLRAPRVVSKLVTNTGWRSNQPVSTNVGRSVYQANRFIPNPSEFTPTTTVSSVPIAPSGGILSAPVTAQNIAPRPSTVAYNIPLATTLPRIAFSGIYGRGIAYNPSGLIFPLNVPAPITSLFGWRTHPISGDRRFHAGMDIGAAMGTPILAAYSGQVEAAGWQGGYGLTVVMSHNNAQQTLYGHMSEIYVQPGQRVEQGSVIGRVGSTGNSTGPHLHFEVRQLTPQGWVAVDPGIQLQFALNQLVNTLQTAQVTRD
ncbi:peptidoglycan DD-metalloendopeptidase family protein [Chlorogloeopsis sp. ULAP01]|uniref:peptidoglycan DD-metalloendopeptidase family protein n=1 Tax=Chlorogloeopsis sp. ULAP01 TaxID=3056483 RepID=UPI0025AAB085|nr:peptidoglycan DD-metalloendopeptidase family protein [Chlorogloeopsis sp. ULAP01]MDM9383101.1 peptidoglycan DD-metalloendopeptidase family protein [Chlorogloeopsis sp. ULAP01]